MSAPELIGREGELALLHAKLARAISGQPATVFVVGEAGVGKTRLVGELAGEARRLGVRWWTGHCVPVTDGLLPYAPVVGVLRGAVTDIGVPALRALAGPAGRQLGPFLPELADGGRGSDTDPTAPNVALLRLLESLGEEPTVLVFEDLHWADPSTRELLVALGPMLRRGRLLLLGTYRDDEHPPDHPMRFVIAEAERLGASVLRVPRLAPAMAVAQMTAILGAEPAQAFADRICTRSGGNPFLVEELLAAAATGSAPSDEALPESLRDLLLVRVRRLPPRAQQVVRTVALAGTGVSHGLLAKAFAEPDSDLVEAVRTAVDHHVLVVSEGRYVFRHALTAEAVRADVLPGERIVIHRAWAGALAARVPAAAVDDAGAAWPVAASLLAAAHAEVAHHWLEAGDNERALPAVVAAGQAAERAHAPAEARAHFQRALALWPLVDGASRDEAGLALVDVYIRAAETTYLSGDVDGALDLVRRGIGVADRRADPLRAAALYQQLGGFLISRGTEAHSLGALATAVEIIPADPSESRAGALANLGTVLNWSMRLDDARAAATEALDVARQVGARQAECAALRVLGLGLCWRGELEAGLASIKEAMYIAYELRYGPELFQVHLHLADALYCAGRFPESAETALEGVSRTHRFGVESIYGGTLQAMRLNALFWSGQWRALGDELAKPTQSNHRLADMIIAGSVAAGWHTAQGRFDLAQKRLDHCRVTADDHALTAPMSFFWLASAELCLWRDDPATARKWVNIGLSRASHSGHGVLLGRLLVLATRAEADLGPTDDALAGELARATERLNPSPFAEALLAQARAELGRGRGESSASEWAAVATAWASLGIPHQQAYACWRLAETLLARRSRAQAARALAEARGLAVRLGADPLLQRVEALTRRARLDLSEVTPNGSAANTVRANGHALTRREEQVLALIGQGRTNRQIARQLFISENTVSIHVSRVLAKLGVTNRVAAATAATRMGMDSPPH